MIRAEIERRLRQGRWPEPGADLRARVLAAVPIVNRRVTWSDRVWFSRGWRVAAAAAVVAAIAIESLPGTTDCTAFVAPPQAVAEAQMIDATGREIGLPPNVAQALAHRTLRTDARPSVADETRLALQALAVEGETK